MRAYGLFTLGTVAVELSSIIDRMPIKELPKCACGARLGVWRDGIGLFLDGYVLVPTVIGEKTRALGPELRVKTRLGDVSRQARID